MTSHVQRIEAEGPAPFFFRAESAPDTALRVLSFQGQEAISRPYRFDVRLATSALDAEGLAEVLLGARARLTLDIPGAEPRKVWLVHTTAKGDKAGRYAAFWLARGRGPRPRAQSPGVVPAPSSWRPCGGTCSGGSSAPLRPSPSRSWRSARG